MENKSDRRLLIEAVMELSVRPCVSSMKWLKVECKADTITGIWNECPNGSWLAFVKALLDEEPQLEELSRVLMAGFSWCLDEFNLMVSNMCKEVNSPSVRVLPPGNKVVELVDCTDGIPLHEFLPPRSEVEELRYNAVFDCLLELISAVRGLHYFHETLETLSGETDDEELGTLIIAPVQASRLLAQMAGLTTKDPNQVSTKMKEAEEWFEKLLAEAIRANTKIPVIAL